MSHDVRQRAAATNALPLDGLGLALLRLLVAAEIRGSRPGRPTPLFATSVPAMQPPDAGRESYPPEAAVDADSSRIAALVDLARDGDAEAFGALYDHYSPQVYRFAYYRLGNQASAEDLVGDTFFRALRAISGFQWQGRDFGAWLMTIARNLVVDHFKSGRNRLESPTDSLPAQEPAKDDPEQEVMSALTNEILTEAMARLPREQQECLTLRFLSGQSIAETAEVLGRSEGAVKQLQLRAVRSLAKLLPEGLL